MELGFSFDSVKFVFDVFSAIAKTYIFPIQETLFSLISIIILISMLIN